MSITTMVAVSAKVESSIHKAAYGGQDEFTRGAMTALVAIAELDEDAVRPILAEVRAALRDNRAVASRVECAAFSLFTLLRVALKRTRMGG